MNKSFQTECKSVLSVAITSVLKMHSYISQCILHRLDSFLRYPFENGNNTSVFYQNLLLWNEDGKCGIVKDVHERIDNLRTKDDGYAAAENRIKKRLSRSSISGRLEETKKGHC